MFAKQNCAIVVMVVMLAGWWCLEYELLFAKKQMKQGTFRTGLNEQQMPELSSMLHTKV